MNYVEWESFYNRQQYLEVNNFQFINYTAFVFLMLLIGRVNYVDTFDCICNCVNFVHLCSLSVVLICNSNKLYAYRNKQTIMNSQLCNMLTYTAWLSLY